MDCFFILRFFVIDRRFVFWFRPKGEKSGSTGMTSLLNGGEIEPDILATHWLLTGTNTGERT
jgi:hypothetical protein